jgi:hypothetical protein
VKRPITKKPDSWDADDVEACIARNDPEELLHIPIWVALSPPNRVWAEWVCVRLASHPDPNVRGNAVEGFGHLARTFRYLNQRVVRPLIEAALEDADEWVRMKADEAAADVEWFLGWVLRGREDRRGRPVCQRPVL